MKAIKRKTYINDKKQFETKIEKNKERLYTIL